MRDPRFTHQWTESDIDRVGSLLREGLSASQIGLAIGVSRNAVISIVHRNKDLTKIGFMRLSDRPSAVKGLPRAEDPNAKPRVRESAVVIPFKNMGRRPAKEPPPLRIIASNESAAVRDWIAKNGQPRTFAVNERTDEWTIKSFLESRGYTLSGGWQGYSKITGNGVRRDKLKWSSVMAFVDELRIREGLQPFKRKA